MTANKKIKTLLFNYLLKKNDLTAYTIDFYLESLQTHFFFCKVCELKKQKFLVKISEKKIAKKIVAYLKTIMKKTKYD